jgi:nucleoside 2-deoxyribosyltransferase
VGGEMTAKKKIKRIYIAGLLTPRGRWSVNPAIDYLANVRHMVRKGLEVFFAGYVPFIPALDFVLFLSLSSSERITEPMIKRYSIDWLEVCDAILLTEGWRESPGTLREIEFAKDKGIPVFETIEDLQKAQEHE